MLSEPTKLGLALCLLTAACGPAPIGLGPSESGSESAATTDPSDTDTSTTDASTTDTSTEDGGTTTATTGSNWFVEPDVWMPDTCDPFAQDCPEGEKCVAYSAWGDYLDANKCVPVTGDRAVGEPCTYDGPVEATDDCDATSMCWQGTCHAFCLGSADDAECPADSFCSISSEPVLVLCFRKCDPIAQDCDSGSACFWDGVDFQCILDTQDIPAGEPCEYINDCAGGLMCVAPEYIPGCGGASCCTPYCNLELGDAQCDAVPGTGCVPFFEQGRAPADYEHIGVCVML